MSLHTMEAQPPSGGCVLKQRLSLIAVCKTVSRLRAAVC